jgi:tripartite-type tricarboxylate transporter receptor subunit TctC
MTWLRLLAWLVLAAPLAAAAQAQPWPSKPLRLIVPYAPGGSTDLLARTVAVKMSEALGEPIVVENHGGANGTLGSNMVARAAPDGYTFLLGTGATHGLTLFLMKSVPYDPVNDFTPITAAVEVPIVLTVNASMPVKNVKELIEYAKKNPGKLAFGSSGTGSPHHLAGELLKQMTGIDLVHVPYKGAGPAVQDLLANQIAMIFTTLSTAMPHYRAGKVKLLGFVEAQGQPSAPEVPTIGASVPGYAMPRSWLGFFGPAKMPAPIVQRLNAEILKALHSPDVKQKLEIAGMPVVGTSAEEFGRMVRDDIETFRKITSAAKIKPE